MKRRSFIKSIAALPLATTVFSEHSNAEVKQSVSMGLYPAESEKLIGIGCGISEIDKKTGGFRNGQLVCVSGQLEEINHAFLINMLIHALVRQGKRIDSIYIPTHVCNWIENKYGFIPLDVELPLRKAMIDASKNPKNSQLRFPDVDLGNSSNMGWKDYLTMARANPPDVLLINGVEMIELLLHERRMAKQLKQLAEELQIPVIVQTPSKKQRKVLTGEDSPRIRKDFEYLCDVEIALFPRFVCMHKMQNSVIGKYFSLETHICINLSAVTNQKGLIAGVPLDYFEWGMRFQAV